MRKIVKMVSAAMLALAIAALAPANLYADEIVINVTINGEAVQFADQGPVVVDGRTLVPVRGVFEHLGFDVDWYQPLQMATLTSEHHMITIAVGSDVFTTDNIIFELEVPAQIINDRTMLPIRQVLESVGFALDWDQATRTVIITGQLPVGADLGLSYDLPSDIADDITRVLTALHPGTARADVESALLVASQRVIQAYGGGYSYRYDLLAEAGYEFAASHDDVDIQGLQEGRVRIIVFVDYNARDEIVWYAVYYSDLNGVIYEFRYWHGIRHSQWS